MQFWCHHFGSQNPSKSCLEGVLGGMSAVLAAREGLWEVLRLVLSHLDVILDRLGAILGRLERILLWWCGVSWRDVAHEGGVADRSY